MNTPEQAAAEVALVAAKAAVRKAVATAMNNWTGSYLDSVNAGAGRNPKSYWDAVRTLKNGLSTTTPATAVKMKKVDGTMCTSEQENAEVFRIHFEKLYNNVTPFDKSMIDEIEQRCVDPTLDQPPTLGDVRRHIKMAKSGKAPGDNQINAEAYKALATEDRTCSLVLDVILDL